MPPISEQASRICSHCGLCCNGSLYSAVPLTPADRSKLIAVAQVPVEANGDLAWLQPCAAHDGSGCTVYDRRPLACREYQCGVLDSVAAGSLSAGDAVMLVSEVNILRELKHPNIVRYYDRSASVRFSHTHHPPLLLP